MMYARVGLQLVARAMQRLDFLSRACTGAQIWANLREPGDEV